LKRRIARKVLRGQLRHMAGQREFEGFVTMVGRSLRDPRHSG
jgi:hypothetical protein